MSSGTPRVIAVAAGHLQGGEPAVALLDAVRLADDELHLVPRAQRLTRIFATLAGAAEAVAAMDEDDALGLCGAVLPQLSAAVERRSPPPTITRFLPAICVRAATR